MSIIDVLARLIGDGPWTQPQAIRNACAAAERTGKAYEVVEVEPSRWVAREAPKATVTEHADGRITVQPLDGLRWNLGGDDE